MEKVKFRTQYNYFKAKGEEGEKNFQPSMTIPDQTMSIREIMQRYARGLPLDMEKTPVYHGEDDEFPDMQRLDLAERQEVIEHYKNEFNEIKEKYSKKPEPPKKPATKKAEDKSEGGQPDPTGDDSGSAGDLHRTDPTKPGK